METNKQLPVPPPPPPPPPQAEGLDGGIFVKVMTDEQMEVLRRQIAAYATICEQLEELHRTLSHNDDHLVGAMRMGNSYSTSLMASSSQKLSRRQRWNPTPEQLHILERVFNQEGVKTPNPHQVKEITAELAHHGQIAEPNVYNWFQNRRARLKKKQMFEAEANIAESGAEMVIESFDAKVQEPQNLQSDESVSKRRNEDICPENTLARTEIVPIHSFQGCPKPSRDFTKMAVHGRMSWEESHNPLLNTENDKHTEVSDYKHTYLRARHLRERTSSAYNA